jgi:hypothetical protein
MYINLNWKSITFAVAALVALIIVVDRAEDWLSHVSYPLDTWRMDLDDAVSNVIAGAAVLVAYLAIRRRQQKTDAKLNGGLKELAQEILLAEIETSGINDTVTSLRADVEEVKQQRDECIGKIEALTAALKGDG